MSERVAHIRMDSTPNLLEEDQLQLGLGPAANGDLEVVVTGSGDIVAGASTGGRSCGGGASSEVRVVGPERLDLGHELPVDVVDALVGVVVALDGLPAHIVDALVVVGKACLTRSVAASLRLASCPSVSLVNISQTSRAVRRW